MQHTHVKRTRGKKGRILGSVSDPAAIVEIKQLLGDSPRQRDLLIEYLHKIQDHYTQISTRHMLALAADMNIPVVEIYETATFYHHFKITAEESSTPKLTLRVCNSMSCEMFGAKKLFSALQDKNITGVHIQSVPCVGRCDVAPVAVLGSNPIAHATVAKISTAIANKQTTDCLRSHINYSSYRANGGYKTLQQCWAGKYSREDIIKNIETSGLCGLGGAGFPTAKKWQILRGQPKPRLIAINIDEGEPGTFKDRYYLEHDPHRFLEGMLIAHWAIEADEIYLYIRDEYTACRWMLEQELIALQNDPPCALPKIHLRRGAGAYICGEESAMIESIEGKRGLPRLRPPYVAEVGLFGRPTLEHNLETMHWIRDIIEQGAQNFADKGHGEHKGLRTFSVSGRVKQPGVHCAPAGISVRTLIDDYCGGMLEGHTLYGYFPGGASGGILPARLDGIPLDFGTLQKYGCFIGSAAIIVLSQQDSVRAAALNAMRFFEHESCGQCTPCRVGTAKAVQLMSAETWDQPLLHELAQVMEDASICGLGQAASNPLKCAIKYFPEEFS